MMKDLKTIRKILREYKSELKENYKVKEIGVFGSFVRGEQTGVSDIDILVEFYEPIGWEFVDIKEFLESILNINVDLVTVNALRPQIKERVLREVVYA